jgi:hypothetical protein
VGAQPPGAQHAFDPAGPGAADEAGWKDANGDGVREGRATLRFHPMPRPGSRSAGVAQYCSGSSGRRRRGRCAARRPSISGLWFEGNFDAMLHWWQMPADPELTLFFAADRMPPRAQTPTTCPTTP